MASIRRIDLLNRVISSCKSSLDAYQEAIDTRAEGPEVMATEVYGQKLSEPVAVVNREARKSNLEFIVDGFTEMITKLDQLTELIRTDSDAEAMSLLSEIIELRLSVARRDGDGVPGFLYKPEGPIPPNAMTSLNKLLGLFKEAMQITSANKYPCWIIFDSELDTQLETHKMQHFNTGDWGIVFKENDEKFYVLNENGTVCWPKKDEFTYHFEGEND